MRNLLFNGSWIMALLLAGCAIGPDYTRPSDDLPSSFRHTDANQSTPLASQWWKELHDPLLDSYIQMALEHNYDLLASQASVDKMLGQFEQIRSSIFPQINGDASMRRIGVNNTTGFLQREGITTIYAASLTLASYEIDLFGKIRRANEAARAQLLASEYAKESMRLSISAAVAASYLKLSSLTEQIALAKENIDLSQQILDLTRLRYAHGTIAKTILLQSEAEWHNAQATLSILEASKVTEEGYFNLLLGRHPASVKTNPLDQLSLPSVPEALPSEVLKRRPDIASAEQQLISANAQIGIAKAGYFPSIKLTGSMGIQSLELNTFLSDPSRVLEITPSITVPLLSWGRIESDVNMAKAEYMKKLSEYQKSIVSALNDTDTALGNMTFARQQLTYQNARSEAMQEALAQTTLQYKSGTIDYSKLLQAQQQWLSAKQSHIIAHQNALTVAVSLRKALGGGWDDLKHHPHDGNN